MMRKQRRRDAAVRTTYNEAAAHYEAHESGLLEAESKTERTHKVKQEEIAGAVSRNSAVNAWKHPLTLGPYGVSFSRTGRHALLAGHGGRAAVLDLHANAPKCEVVAGECVRAAVFLHDETMFACAQKKYVYVYDDSGAEVHRMKQHLEPEHLSFLPFHFLLASMGHSGYLKYHDVSTGTLVSEHATRLGSAHSLAQNPQSGVLDVGHGNGVVTLWSPASPQPLARVLAHRGGVAALAHSACGPGADVLDFSQRGMLAVACAHSNGVEVTSPRRRRRRAPYLSHALAGGVAACAARFRPFEDALLVGHARGVDSILVPGSAEANYDALEGENPFRTKNQRKTAVVRGLLDKLPPETIALAGADFVGQVERDPEAAKKDKRALEDAANAKLEQKIRDKKKTRGRSKLKAKLKKRLKNVISKETNMLRDKVADEAAKKRKRKAGGDGAAAAAGDDAPATSTALDRLFSRAKKSDDGRADAQLPEAWTRKARAQGRAGDAVFVERGALRALGAEDLAADAAPGPGRKPALLPTEQRMVDRDAHAVFLEDQLRRVSDMVLQLDAKEADVARTMAAAEARAADDRLADLLDGRREPSPASAWRPSRRRRAQRARVLELEKALHRAASRSRPDDDDGASSLGDDVEAALRDATEEGVRCRAAAEAADRRFPLSPETLETDAPAIHTMSEAESALDAARESARCAADDAVTRAAAAEDEAAGLSGAALCASSATAAPLDDAPLPLPRCRASDDDDGAAAANAARRGRRHVAGQRPSPQRLAAPRLADGLPGGALAVAAPRRRRPARRPPRASSPPAAGRRPRPPASPASPPALASPASPVASAAPRRRARRRPRAARPRRARSSAPARRRRRRRRGPRRPAPARGVASRGPRRDGADVTRLAAARESRLRGDALEPADEPPPLPPHALGGGGRRPCRGATCVAMIPRLFADDYAGEPAPRARRRRRRRGEEAQAPAAKRKSPPLTRGAMAGRRGVAALEPPRGRRALGESWPSSVMHCGPNTRAWVPAIKVAAPPRRRRHGVRGDGPGH
ncbi:hypothetical protein JL722_13418 [Aureococcus anophagefferens]|nr:hypothetical protein JL722_13418 [Aureococcus anophagefferens]